jgi:hypothetical protein
MLPQSGDIVLVYKLSRVYLSVAWPKGLQDYFSAADSVDVSDTAIVRLVPPPPPAGEDSLFVIPLAGRLQSASVVRLRVLPPLGSGDHKLRLADIRHLELRLRSLLLCKGAVVSLPAPVHGSGSVELIVVDISDVSARNIPCGKLPVMPPKSTWGIDCGRNSYDVGALLFMVTARSRVIINPAAGGEEARMENCGGGSTAAPWIRPPHPVGNSCP